MAAIIGHLSFFLRKESPRDKILDQAAQIYQQSTSDSSVKQAVENLFEGYHAKHGIFNRFKSPHVDETLVEGALQIALNNCLCMI